jgi:hypothetical protein
MVRVLQLVHAETAPVGEPLFGTASKLQLNASHFDWISLSALLVQLDIFCCLNHVPILNASEVCLEASVVPKKAEAHALESRQEPWVIRVEKP